MTEYSGRTTSHSHKFGDWKEKDADGKDCIQQKTIFDVQWSNCPVEVENEVRKLWRNYDLGNDYFYFRWDSNDHSEDYPIIDEYLKSRNVAECLIHWWW